MLPVLKYYSFREWVKDDRLGADNKNGVELQCYDQRFQLAPPVIQDNMILTEKGYSEIPYLTVSDNCSYTPRYLVLVPDGDEFLGLLWRDKIHGVVGSEHDKGPYLLSYRITKSSAELVEPLHVIRVLQKAKLIGMTPADGTGKLTNWLRKEMPMEESMAWFAINTHAQGDRKSVV